MLYNLTLCKACLQRLVTTNKFVRLKSHYAVLGVSNSATQKDIRDAYIKLSKKLHPDQNRHDTKSHEKFVQINEAYEVLSKDSSRRNYDDTLRVRNQPGKDFGTYGTSHRPPNYYSSGQFYEDQGYYYNHYNPYSKRNQQSNYDPFSSYGYEQHQRQREWEKQAAEDFGIDKKFRQRISRIYAFFIAIPFYFGFFYAFNEMCNNSHRRMNTEYFGAIRYTIILLLIPYLLLRLTLLYMVTSEKAFGSRVRPRYTSNSDRKAHEEKLTLQLQLYAALICILAGFTIFFNILNEDRSLVLRQYVSEILQKEKSKANTSDFT